jgi:Rrf2 family transcriptional regulator, cysteine metabolism repressor
MQREAITMQVSQKCQYTLRALFELAKRGGAEPVAAAEIADAQAIPSRFLELILQDLRSRGMVESRRGNKGGYALAISPKTTSVGDVIRAVDGPLAPVKCVAGRSDESCRLKKTRCAFMGVWERARKAMEEVYDNTTLQNLIDDERAAAEQRGLPAFAV